MLAQSAETLFLKSNFFFESLQKTFYAPYDHVQDIEIVRLD